ncbi:beta-lactamase [Mycolicibacterium conceptionense]|uniref:Beta-lactamase n=1 Tax=Mycolicibacterium conceptionense TaxID=451644 RepID=A0A0U1DVT7_9MYCO|nr:beta-lactamase [Mycolicibacterium conceptionense]
MCWTLQGPLPRRSRGRTLHRTVGLTAITAVAAALACGCSPSVAPAAEVSYGAHIDTITPPGLRAKQTMDMLNSDWPIGPIGVRTLAAPEKVDLVGTKMDSIWWDRPFKVTSVDIGAAQATLHVLTSYNVAQDIELRTNDAGLVDRFDVTLVPPKIETWSDIDTELTKSGARYSYRVSKVVGGKCEQVAGTNTELSLPLASIFKLYVLLAVSDAIKAGTCAGTITSRSPRKARSSGQPAWTSFRPGPRSPYGPPPSR